MTDTKKAFEVLGVNEDASKADIEKRYFILMKKHRQSTALGEGGEAEEGEFREQTEAYNLLMGYEEPQTAEAANAKPNPVYQKMGLDEKKVNNFFYYYKFHIIGGIILLLFMAYIVRSCATTVKPDFSVAFIGNINYMDSSEKLTQIAKTEFPGVKELGVDGAFITPNGNAPTDQAGLMKSMALFSAGGIDVYVLDSANFQKLAKDDAFIRLDDIATKLGTDAGNNKLGLAISKTENKQHLFGIDVGKSSVLARAGIQAGEMIAVIPQNTKYVDKSVAFIKYLMK